jgi:DNA invertase Pin-like site-specific DNA recombinase
MKAAIYCRVSTDDQDKEGTSLQTQLEACLKYCQEKGYHVYTWPKKVNKLKRNLVTTERTSA